MIITSATPTWAFFLFGFLSHLMSLSTASHILSAAQTTAPAVITKSPSSSDLENTDSSTLTQAPNTATALPITLPTTTSTTTVHGYMLFILPPEPVSYNTSNYTTSSTTVASYAAAPNVTFPSPKRVKDLAGIIFPSILGGGAVVGGLSAWGIGWYLWKDFQRAMTDFPETDLDSVARDFIEVGKAKSWEETVRREEDLERYRRMGQLENFLIKQERKMRGTRFTKAQWSKVKDIIAPDQAPFNPPPPPNCVVLCGEVYEPTYRPPPTWYPTDPNAYPTAPETYPPRPKTSKSRTQPSTTRTRYPSGRTRYPGGPSKDWPVWSPPTDTASWSSVHSKYRATCSYATCTSDDAPPTTTTTTNPPDSKGKRPATARDTETDCKSNWYSKTVDPDTLTTTPTRTPKMPPPTQASTSAKTPPPSSSSQVATSTHHPGKPPPPWYTQAGNNPPHPRPYCTGFNFKDCCIYIAGLEVKCFPY